MSSCTMQGAYMVYLSLVYAIISMICIYWAITDVVRSKSYHTSILQELVYLPSSWCLWKWASWAPYHPYLAIYITN